MRDAIQASGLIVSGLLLILGIVGAWTASSSAERARFSVLMAVAAALTLSIAGRRHEHVTADVLGWVLVLMALGALWRSRPRRPQAVVDDASLIVHADD